MPVWQTCACMCCVGNWQGGGPHSCGGRGYPTDSWGWVRGGGGAPQTHGGVRGGGTPQTRVVGSDQRLTWGRGHSLGWRGVGCTTDSCWGQGCCSTVYVGGGGGRGTDSQKRKLCFTVYKRFCVVIVHAVERKNLFNLLTIKTVFCMWCGKCAVHITRTTHGHELLSYQFGSFWIGLIPLGSFWCDPCGAWSLCCVAVLAWQSRKPQPRARCRQTRQRWARRTRSRTSSSYRTRSASTKTLFSSRSSSFRSGEGTVPWVAVVVCLFGGVCECVCACVCLLLESLSQVPCLISRWSMSVVYTASELFCECSLKVCVCVLVVIVCMCVGSWLALSCSCEPVWCKAAVQTISVHLPTSTLLSL